MNSTIVAALISGGITMLGFVINGMMVNRWLDNQRNKDKRKNERRESLETLFHATCIAKSAARDLSVHSAGLTTEELVYKTCDSLQKMAQFFQKVSEAGRDLHLGREDVAKTKVVQSALVNVFLLLDPDSKDPDLYRANLAKAYGNFEDAFSDFESYIRSAVASF